MIEGRSALENRVHLLAVVHRSPRVRRAHRRLLVEECVFFSEAGLFQAAQLMRVADRRLLRLLTRTSKAVR